MLKHSKDENEKKNLIEKFFSSFNKGFSRLTNRYTKSVSSWIKKTPYVLVMMIVLFVGLFFLFKNKPTGFIPIEDEGACL
jgi:HAE1 family hydrophobic/amphiphilic exporter-1